MSPIETLMRKWLCSGDPVKVRHARGRIAIGFAGQPDLPPSVPVPRSEKPRIALGKKQKG